MIPGRLNTGGFGEIHDGGGDGTVYKIGSPRARLGHATIMREAAALTVLRGVPGVIELLGFGVWGDEAQPYVRLPDLSAHSVLCNLEIPYPHCLATWLLVAETIGMCHQRGVIHRDIKPDNIFIVPGRPIVIDFGLAHIQGQPEMGGMEEYVLGTPMCMPPEQLESPPPTPHVSHDIYQLGVLLHWLVEGEWPWPDGNYKATMRAIHQGTVMAIRPEMECARRALMWHRDFDAGYKAVSEVLTEWAYSPVEA